MSVYAFGPFVLEATERRLTREGRRIVVPGKAWKILVMLVEAGGLLVSHEALRARLWPDVIVEDRTLTVHVSTLRKVLGAGAGVVETVSRVGYRLAVEVRASSEAVWSPPDTSLPSTTGRIAVTSFSTSALSDAETYLGVGIADAVSTTLGTVAGLTVSPVQPVENPAHMRALGVGHLLEGTVERSAESLRVSARLIEVASGRTEWSECFEHLEMNGAALQDAIAARVATSLPQGVVLAPGMPSYRPRAAEAYFLQLEARAHLKSFTRLPLIKALTLFEQALALDPDYAMAHAGLASTYLLMASTAMLRPLQVDEAMPMARRHAQRAIAIDDGLAEAWAALGRVKMEYEWDWNGAEADLSHAVALNASSVEALGTLGQFLSSMGRHDEAVDYMEQARRLDPRNVETLQHLAIVYWMADQGERALDAVDESLRVLPGSPRAHYGRMMILDQLGRRDEAMVERITTLRGLAIGENLAGELEATARDRGWRVAMGGWIDLLERTNRWEGAAMQWMAVGDSSRAMDALEHCVRARTTYLCFTAQNPYFRSLHNKPRFREILKALKFDARS